MPRPVFKTLKQPFIKHTSLHIPPDSEQCLDFDPRMVTQKYSLSVFLENVVKIGLYFVCILKKNGLYLVCITFFTFFSTDLLCHH